MLINRAGIHKTVVREHREDPELICFYNTALACTAWLGLFGSQLEFEILEHLLENNQHFAKA